MEPGRHRKSKRHCIIAATLCVISLPLFGQSWQPPPKPSPGLMPNPVAGKPLYETHCSSCHGTDLKGTDSGPPFLHRIYESSHHSDAAFQLAVASGVRAHHWEFGDMAAVAGLDPDQVAHITAYIRTHQRRVGIR